jgi:DNA (cytosine-5)-methyltransferase 1
MAKRSAEAKRRATVGEAEPKHEINVPNLNPETLMPQLIRNGLKTLSLFSGGGGLDLGFDRAGFEHLASYEIVTDAGATLSFNRPQWDVRSGDQGNVMQVNWRHVKADVIHAGPPCQPFSSAGRQLGHEDERNLFPEFIRAVREIKPLAFVAENVRALLNGKFSQFVQEQIVEPLSRDYVVHVFDLSAASFGVPQVRTRVFFVGFRRGLKTEYCPPSPTHHSEHFSGDNIPPLAEVMRGGEFRRCMGAREALGLPEIGFDALAPTLRSGLTGPRHTTSVLSSVSALKVWNKLQIWPNGVGASREAARRFVPDNGHFRLSVPDCALLQGFPESWRFSGAVYKSIGQIGNSVAPPMAYHVALSISRALASAA